MSLNPGSSPLTASVEDDHSFVVEADTSRQPDMRPRIPRLVFKASRDSELDAASSPGEVYPASDHEDKDDSGFSSRPGDSRSLSIDASSQELKVDPLHIDSFPKLEESMRPQYLPQTLCVHDPDRRVAGTEPTEDVLYYRRVFPPPSLDDEGTQSSGSNSPNVSHLYLTRESRIGCGHHSNAYRASFSLPHPPEAIPGSNRFVVVVAKVAVPRKEAREHLQHEAAIYDAFPIELTEEFCGQAIVPGIESPVVPNFFGYYSPEEIGYDASDVRKPSPLLLLEDCGIPIDPKALSHEEKAECLSLFLRLHSSGFLQKSAFKKNIVVQPGPLTIDPSKRSLESPSFRVIDFGRAIRRPQQNPKEWLDEKEAEVRDVQKVLRIPRYSTD